MLPNLGYHSRKTLSKEAYRYCDLLQRFEEFSHVLCFTIFNAKEAKKTAFVSQLEYPNDTYHLAQQC